MPSFAAMTVLIARGLVSMAQGEDLPPVVNAGADVTVPSEGAYANLRGTATDDSTVLDSSSMQWTQISGPAQPWMSVSTDGRGCRVRFPEPVVPGTYSFEFRATDGKFSSADTVQVTVRQSLPFMVLAPTDTAPVEIGKPYTIRWQMDPSGPCIVSCSFDSGLTYTSISIIAVRDSLVWDVDSNPIAGTFVIIRVSPFHDLNRRADGTCVLISTTGVNVNQRTAARPFRIDLDNSGSIRIRGLPQSCPARVTVFDSDGRIALAAEARNGFAGRISPAFRTSGIHLYRVVAETGLAWKGRLAVLHSR